MRPGCRGAERSGRSMKMEIWMFYSNLRIDPHPSVDVFPQTFDRLLQDLSSRSQRGPSPPPGVSWTLVHIWPIHLKIKHSTFDHRSAPIVGKTRSQLTRSGGRSFTFIVYQSVFLWLVLCFSFGIDHLGLLASLKVTSLSGAPGWFVGCVRARRGCILGRAHSSRPCARMEGSSVRSKDGARDCELQVISIITITPSSVRERRAPEPNRDRREQLRPRFSLKIWTNICIKFLHRIRRNQQDAINNVRAHFCEPLKPINRRFLTNQKVTIWRSLGVIDQNKPGHPLTVDGETGNTGRRRVNSINLRREISRRARDRTGTCSPTSWNSKTFVSLDTNGHMTFHQLHRHLL